MCWKKGVHICSLRSDDMALICAYTLAQFLLCGRFVQIEKLASWLLATSQEILLKQQIRIKYLFWRCFSPYLCDLPTENFKAHKIKRHSVSPYEATQVLVNSPPFFLLCKLNCKLKGAGEQGRAWFPPTQRFTFRPWT